MHLARHYPHDAFKMESKQGVCFHIMLRKFGTVDSDWVGRKKSKTRFSGQSILCFFLSCVVLSSATLFFSEVTSCTFCLFSRKEKVSECGLRIISLIKTHCRLRLVVWNMISVLISNHRHKSELFSYRFSLLLNYEDVFHYLILFVLFCSRSNTPIPEAQLGG